MALPRRASRIVLSFSAAALAILMLTGAIGEGTPGYVWMGQVTEGNALFVYGAQDSPEDMLFWIECNAKKKSTEMALYEEIPGAKVRDPITLELAGAAANVALKGKITTDEMSGFHYAVAESFKVKPVLDLFRGKGPVTVKAGKLTSSLPDKGRAEALTKFAKGCTLD